MDVYQEIPFLTHLLSRLPTFEELFENIKKAFTIQKSFCTQKQKLDVMPDLLLLLESETEYDL